MTMPMDVFSPAETSANPQSAAAEWTAALQDPKVKATLLSAGLQLMQPPSFGQTAGGQLAQAVGAGAEGLARQNELDRQDREEQLKLREQSRKETDTDSNVEYRKDRTDIGIANNEVSRIRADAATLNAQSQAALRESQIQTNLARVGKIESEVKMLEMKVQLLPQDAQAKTELARKKMELYEAQTRVASERAAAIAPVSESVVQRNNSVTGLNRTREGVIEPTAASVQKKNEAQAGLANERAGAVQKNADNASISNDLRKSKLTLQEKLEAQRGERQNVRTYENAKKEHERSRVLDSKLGAFPSYQDWKKKNGLDGSTATAPTTSPNANAPVSADAEVAQAKAAIARGADPTAVKNLFKQRTGKDLPE